MLKTIGRIILLAVGAFMIYSCVTSFMSTLNTIKDIYGGFSQFFEALLNGEKRTEALNYLGSLAKCVGLIIVAISAILAGISGHGGFWFTIFSLVLLGLFIWDVYGKVKSGAFEKDTMKVILNLVIDSIAQLGYIVGFIFLKLGKSKE